MSYRATLTCCRCGAKRYVPSIAERFKHWVCWQWLGTRWCKQMNVWSS